MKITAEMNEVQIREFFIEYLKCGNPSALLNRIVNAAIAVADLPVIEANEKENLLRFADKMKVVRDEETYIEDCLFGTEG